jgi:hypothetical protein
MAKMQPPGNDFFIYGEPANINYFLNTTLEPVTVAGAENRQSSVSAHTRRRYVGDPTPINVSGSQREWLYDPGRKVGNALPGSPFILSDGVETRQFTLQGNLIDLHAFLVGDAAMPLTLTSADGAKYAIAAATGGNGA